VDSTTGRALRTIALQYNPDTLTRSLSPQAAGGEGQGGRGEALRLKAPAVETIRLEACDGSSGTSGREHHALLRATKPLGRSLWSRQIAPEQPA
jgi:hypothetical protein